MWKINFLLKHAPKIYEIYLFEHQYTVKNLEPKFALHLFETPMYFKRACNEDHTWWTHSKYMGILEICEAVLQYLFQDFLQYFYISRNIISWVLEVCLKNSYFYFERLRDNYLQIPSYINFLPHRASWSTSLFMNNLETTRFALIWKATMKGCFYRQPILNKHTYGIWH